MEFKKISFSYPSNSREIIKNLSFKINKGEILGISGDSGIGKTTLAEIILGLQNPSSGKILLNNKKINLTKSNFRNIISYIPQKTFLFDATIDENITLFEKNVDYKKLNLIKKICNINFEKKGKNSFVGETGNKLSGGQIQRIGIARGLYRNHSILILDEPTSSLDKTNENLIIKNILKFKKNNTLIIISHNPKILSFCKRKSVSKQMYKVTIIGSGNMAGEYARVIQNISNFQINGIVTRKLTSYKKLAKKINYKVKRLKISDLTQIRSDLIIVVISE